MNLAYKVGQFRLRFAHLEKSAKFGGGTKFTIRFADWVKCIVEYLTITWIIWLDKSIKSRFWESYLFEERAKISAVLILEKRPVGKHSLCWSADHLRNGIWLWVEMFEGVYLPKGRVFRTNLRVTAK